MLPDRRPRLIGVRPFPFAMDRKRLEMLLQRVPPHPSPDPALEQYSTTAPVAATMVFEAAMLGDIEDMEVADLGCGTGVLAIGAALMGASRVVGVDVDGPSLDLADAAAADLGVRIDFERMDVDDLQGDFDTVVMNPPFGAQRRGADRAFLEKAMEVADVVHSLHNGPTLDFVMRFIGDRGFEVTHVREQRLVIPHMHAFHERESRAVEVYLLRSERGARVPLRSVDVR